MGAPAATVVLVHGAWHGAWCFDRVVPLVRDEGVAACAIDLPGTGFESDVAFVKAPLDALDGDVVLLGHSYGGAVVTDAGTHSSACHLVYLCAFAITEHESCTNATSGEPDSASISHVGRPSLGDAMVSHDDGTTTLTRDGAQACLYADVDDSTFEWAYPQLRAQRNDSLSAMPNDVAWRTKPSTYVVCTEDQGVHPGLQRIMARRCTETVEWQVGHSPFANRPDLVADLVVELAHQHR